MLASRSTPHLVQTLTRLAEAWLDPDFPFRRFALEQGPAITGFSTGTLARGLDAFFQQLTQAQCKALLVQDVGHPQRLDEMIGPAGQESTARAVACRDSISSDVW